MYIVLTINHIALSSTIIVVHNNDILVWAVVSLKRGRNNIRRYNALKKLVGYNINFTPSPYQRKLFHVDVKHNMNLRCLFECAYCLNIGYELNYRARCGLFNVGKYS